MEEIGFEQLAGVLDARLLVRHAALETLLRRRPRHRPCHRAAAAGCRCRARSICDVAGGLFERELHGGIARLRMADERRPFQSERVHEFRDDVAAIGGRVIGRHIGQAEARLIEGDDAEAGARERPEIADEHIGRGAERGAVQQQHRRALGPPRCSAVRKPSTVTKLSFTRVMRSLLMGGSCPGPSPRLPPTLFEVPRTSSASARRAPA